MSVKKSLCGNTLRIVLVGTVALALLLPGQAWSKLPVSLEKELESAKFVYISSTRKDGSLSRQAEIWFMYHDGAVYVGTSPNSWRVKRIRWGRPQAKIWVGTKEGSSFTAKGEVASDPTAQERLLSTYAKKYPDGWSKWEKSFRDGFKDGSRVLVKYTPSEEGTKEEKPGTAP